MAIVRKRTCRVCGRELKDKASLLIWRVGSECRKGMSEAELAEAMRLTREESQPGYIPPAKPASAAAALTNAEARAVVEAAEARETCARHGGLPGECAQCRAEEDPAWGVQRIIKAIQEERRRGVPQRPLRPWPLPYRRYVQEAAPRRRPHRPDPPQLGLFDVA